MMTPSEFDSEKEGAYLSDGLELTRKSARVGQSSVRRTKRIRVGRRNNSINGIQRRRNKRIDW